MPLNFLPDTRECAQAAGDTCKRPGHDRRAGFTGGNLEGVCVREAVKRQKPHPGDPRKTEEKEPPCSI